MYVYNSILKEAFEKMLSANSRYNKFKWTQHTPAELDFARVLLLLLLARDAKFSAASLAKRDAENFALAKRDAAKNVAHNDFKKKKVKNKRDIENLKAVRSDFINEDTERDNTAYVRMVNCEIICHQADYKTAFNVYEQSLKDADDQYEQSVKDADAQYEQSVNDAEAEYKQSLKDTDAQCEQSVNDAV